MTIRRPNERARVTPGIKNIFDRVSNRRQSDLDALAIAEEQRGGKGFVQGAIDKAVKFPVAQASKGLTTVAKAFEVLGYGNKYVVQPALGSAVYIMSSPEERAAFDAKYGFGSGKFGAWNGGMRDLWKKDNTLPGPAKFVAEIGLDPTTWVGLGLWKSSGIKFAERLLPYAMDAEATGVAGRLGATASGIFRPFAQYAKVGKLASHFERTGSIAKLEEASRRGLPARDVVTGVISDAVKAGVLHEDEAVNATRLMINMAERPGGLRGIAPGLFTRILSPTQLHRLLGPADMLTDAIWRVPFSVAAPGVSAALGGRGANTVALANAVGKSAAGQVASKLAAKFGPKAARALPEAADAGMMGTYLAQKSPDSMMREVYRRFTSMWDKVEYYSAVHPRYDSPWDVIKDFRIKGAATDDVALGMSIEDRNLMVEALDPEFLDDTAFRAMLNTADEDVVKARMQAVVQERLVQDSGYLHIPLTGDLTVGNKMWGFAADMINLWRPLVTTLNPAFQILNVMGNLVERGGSGLVIKADGKLAREMVKHGLPKEMVPYLERDFLGLVNDLPEATKRSVKAVKFSRFDNRTLGQIMEQAPVMSSIDMQVGGALRNSDSFWQKIKDMRHLPGAWTARADFGAQLHHMASATSDEALRLLMTAPPESPLSKLRTTYIESFEDGRINLALKTEMDKALPMLLSSGTAEERTEIVNDLLRKFSYENIHTEAARARPQYGMLEPQAQAAYELALHDAIDNRGLMPREAIGEAIGAARRASTATGPLRKMVDTQRTWVRETDKALSNSFGHENLFPEGTFRRAQAVSQKTMKDAAYAAANAMEPYNRKAANALRGDAGRAARMVSTNVDVLSTQHIMQAAMETGVPSMAVIPAYLVTAHGWVDNVAMRIRDAHEGVVAYKAAIEANDAIAMREALNKMGAAHGDFKPLIDRFADPNLENPSFGDIVEQFGHTSKNVWHQYSEAKLNLADAITTHMALGRFDPNTFAQSVRYAEQEMFMQGDTAARRVKWANYLSDLQGFTDTPVPVINRTQRAALSKREGELVDWLTDGSRPYADDGEKQAERMKLKRLRQAKSDAQEKIVITNGEAMELNVLKRQEVDAGGNLAPEQLKRLEELEAKNAAAAGDIVDPELQRAQALLGRQRVALTDEELATLEMEYEDIADQLYKAPTKPYQQLELDYLNHMHGMGALAADSVAKLFPHNYKTIQDAAFQKWERWAMETGLNEVTDREGVKLLGDTIRKVGAVADDELVRGEVDMLMSQAGKKGLKHMNQMMANYGERTNAQELISSIFPFASFQMHLPGYLARTFMKRPGIIFAMNHFADAAQENYGGTGGLAFMPIMGNVFVLAPHLRFSYLPIMAGNVYANPEDHPANQVMDMVSAFGFSPGPHVQMAMDLGNKIGQQFGLDQAMPEFREGLVPQWRFVQDLTSQIGINQSKGLTVPWIGPSGDVRERETSRELAARVHRALDEARKTSGRDLYPEEVNAIRRNVWETQTEDARQSVAARDMIVAALPGVKTHAADIDDVRKRASDWMTSIGVEGVQPSNVAYQYTKLDRITKDRLLQELPEFEDVLAVPPWQETGQGKVERVARSNYFKARDNLFANYTKEQRSADDALEAGTIDSQQWREIHDRISKNRAGGIQALEEDPTFKPFLDIERQAPSRPEELAYDTLAKLTPTDVNENGVIDDEDMDIYFDVREKHVRSQPGWIQDYILERQSMNDTPAERDFGLAGRVLGEYFDIPKWVGFSTEESNVATRVLERAREFAKLSKVPTSMTQLIMTMPGLTREERQIGMAAQNAQVNPARFQFWVANPELDYWYPDFRPSQPTPRRPGRSRR